MTNPKHGPMESSDKDEENDLAGMGIESGFAATKVIVDRYRTKGLTKISCDSSVLISVNPVNVQEARQDVDDKGSRERERERERERDPDHQLVVSRCASAKEAIVSGRHALQVFIVTGESNSGKTTLCASLIDTLLSPSTHPGDSGTRTAGNAQGRGQDLQNQASLLAMFASASTVLNTSSTRLISKTTMSLDDKGNVSGIMYDLDCLEITRVVVPRPGQTNFFPLEALGRYLLAHTAKSQSSGSGPYDDDDDDDDDDPKFHKILNKWLSSPSSDRPLAFRILANSQTTATGGRAMPSWEAIRQKMGDIGLSRQDTNGLKARLAAVLLLGNVDSGKGLVEAIEDIIEWWGNVDVDVDVDPAGGDTQAGKGVDHLKATLDTHQGTNLWEWIRDGMCMSIYGMCLRKLVKYINDENADLMMAGDMRLGLGTTSIGSIVVLDTPGMECFGQNLLDQMLFNSMNSILQAMLLDHLSLTSLTDPDSRTCSSFEIFSSDLLSTLTECSKSNDCCAPLLSLAKRHPHHFRFDPNNPLSLDMYHDNRWISYETDRVPQHNRGGPGREMRETIELIVKVGSEGWLVYRPRSPPKTSPASASASVRVATDTGLVKAKVRDGQNLSKVVEKYENRLKKIISAPRTGVSWIYCFNLNPNRQDPDLVSTTDASARSRAIGTGGGIDEQDLRIKLESSGLVNVIREINEKWPIRMSMTRFIDMFDGRWVECGTSNDGSNETTTSKLERFLDSVTHSAQPSMLASPSKPDDVDAPKGNHRQSHYRIRGHGASAQIYLDAHLGGLVQKLKTERIGPQTHAVIPSFVDRKTKNPFRTVRASASSTTTLIPASSGPEATSGSGSGSGSPFGFGLAGIRVAADVMQRGQEAANDKERSRMEERKNIISGFESEVGKLQKDIEAKGQDIRAKDHEIKVMSGQTRRMEDEIYMLNNKVERLQVDMENEKKDKEHQRQRAEKQNKDMAELLAAKTEELDRTRNQWRRCEQRSKGQHDKIKELHNQLDKWVSLHLKSIAYIPPISSISVSLSKTATTTTTTTTKINQVGDRGGHEENGDPLLWTVASYINNALASFEPFCDDDDVHDVHDVHDDSCAFDKAFDSLLNTVHVIAEDKGSLAVDRLLPLVHMLDLLIGLVSSATATATASASASALDDDLKNTVGAQDDDEDEDDDSVEYRLKACRRQLFSVIPDRLSSQLSRAVHGTRSVTPRIIVPALDAALMACAFLRPSRVPDSTGGDEYDQLLNVMAAWVHDLVRTARLELPNPHDDDDDNSHRGSETRSAYTSDMSGVEWKKIGMPEVEDWYTNLFRASGH